jgi:hypothetical protein
VRQQCVGGDIERFSGESSFGHFRYSFD